VVGSYTPAGDETSASDTRLPVVSAETSARQPEPPPAQWVKRPEDAVVHEVWREFPGRLAPEFVVESERPRRIDGVIVEAAEARLLTPRQTFSLADENVIAVQAKRGKIGLGLLGQTLFGARLIERQHPTVKSVMPLAAAVYPNTRVQELLRLVPDEMRVEVRTFPELPEIYPALSFGRSSDHDEGRLTVRDAMVRSVASSQGGQVIMRRRSSDLARIRVATGDDFRVLAPTAVILPARRGDAETGQPEVEIGPEEHVILVYTCTDLYMTFMGRAVYGVEMARTLFGLRRAEAIAIYGRDNNVLRRLLTPYEARGVRPILFRA